VWDEAVVRDDGEDAASGEESAKVVVDQAIG